MTPETVPQYDFDLAALLKLNDLNLRQVAEDNKNLNSDRYYKLLSQFLSLAPSASEAIKQFADDSSGLKDWKSIRELIALFEEMSCDVYIPDLVAIRSANERGDHWSAASHAGKIDKSFNDLYSKISAAKKAKKKDSDSETDTTLFLSIRELDKEDKNNKLLVLAVDDSPAILEAVAAVLNVEYKVFKLPKPEMLTSVLEKVTPDLFLLDYHMPELNGFELIPIIRGLEGHKETPIVFLTSEGTVDNITAAIGLGACDFIVKPFNPDQLREKVAKHIVRRP